MIPPTGRWIGWARPRWSGQAGAIGDYASYYRPDEGAVLEDLDQRLERNTKGVADEVGGAGKGEVAKKTIAATPMAVRNGLSRGLSRRLCSP